jgi:SAP domain-containing ribonucleoprotein
MATDFSRLTVADLRQELKRRNLSQTGKKADLIDRLNAFESEQAASEPREDPVDDNQEARDLPHEQPKTEPKPDVDSKALRPSTADDAPQAPVDSQDIEDKPTAIAAPAKLEEESAPTKDSVAGETALEIEEVAPKVEDAAPKAEDADAIPATEIITDAVSRKRRSRSPPPEPESSRKRARPSDQTREEDISEPRNDHGRDLPETQAVPASQTADSHAATRETPQYNQGDQDVPPQEHSWRQSREVTPPHYQERQGDAADEPMTDYDRDVAPAQHPATSALYIKNFMRPLREPVLRDYLIDLAALPGAHPDPSCVVDFFLDPIRTHAFVSFTSISAASRVRTALHGTVWPNERNRKELWVDFIPEDKVAEWIDQEQAERGRGSSSRWEVHYEPDDNGNITANLVNAEMEPIRRNSTRQPLGPPPVPSGPPRGFPGVEGAPSGPRGRGPNHYRQAPPPPAAPATYDDRDRARDRGGVITTRSDPPLQYRPVPEELAERRLDNLKAHITKDRHRDLGRPDEINRYTFENGDQFVDRGKEAFIGIRPPHRERERRRLGLGRGGGNRSGPPPPPRRRTPSPRRSSRDDDGYRGGGGRDDYDRYRDRDRDYGRDRFRDDVPRSRFDGQPLPTYTGGGGRGGRRGGGRRERY